MTNQNYSLKKSYLQIFINVTDLNIQIDIKKLYQKKKKTDLCPHAYKSGPQQQSLQQTIGTGFWLTKISPIQKNTECSFQSSKNKFEKLFSLFTISHVIRNNKFLLRLCQTYILTGSVQLREPFGRVI